jgi:cbb3-type cytochrome oxidase maturation protein
VNIFYLLIGVSLIAAIIFLILFIKAVKTGQFDDTYTPSVRILFDDEEIEEQEKENTETFIDDSEKVKKKIRKNKINYQ